MPEVKVFTNRGLGYAVGFICLMIYVQIFEQQGGTTEAFATPWWFASGFLGLFYGTIVVSFALKKGGLEKEAWLEKQEILGKA